MSTENSTRPSFVVDVRHMLNDGLFASALDLAASGVRMYPSYLGGYIMLMHAFDALAQSSDAEVIHEEIKRRFGIDIPHEVPLSIPDVASQEVQIEPPVELQPEVQNEPVHDQQPEVQNKNVFEALHEVYSPLRIINLAHQADDTRIIRSSSVRLIPGLEYTSLRYEGAKHRGRRSIQSLGDPPPFREFHAPRRSPFPSDVVQPQKRLSLEELADRIGRVKIKTDDAAKLPSPADPTTMPKTSVVSETLANIYMMQGNYTMAIEAFTILQKQQPNNYKKFEALVEECKKKMGDS